MAVSLLGNEVSELCIGKPPLKILFATTNTVGDALYALKRQGETFLSIWTGEQHLHADGTAGGLDKTATLFDVADIDDDDYEDEQQHDGKKKDEECCWCVGKVCMVDVVGFLCEEENLSSPVDALQKPLSVLLHKVQGLVKHLDPHASISEAIDLILEGAQNLVVPIQERSRKKHTRKLSNSTLPNGREYCWITQEDIIQFILNSIGLFSPTSIQPINSLNIIETESILAVHYEDPAISALPLILQALVKQTSVAVVDNDRKLIDEIAPFMLNCGDESVSAAILTLSAGDLMAYIDYGGPPDDLVQVVKEGLEKRNMKAILELMEEDSGIWSSGSSSYSSSSDDEYGSWKSGGASLARALRRSESSVCSPTSSLVAVMFQALAHRVNYVWVVEDDGTLVGIVTFAGMLKVFREYPYSAGVREQNDKMPKPKH